MAERLPVDTSELLKLAESREAGCHDRLLLGLAELCALRPFGQGETGETAADVLITLTRRAELRIRAQLAERLAEVPWAPHDLIVFLAYDDIEAAEPVLTGSPVLTEEDLIDIVQKLGEAHQRCIARRPGITGPVCEAIAEHAEIRVLPVLLENETAEITEPVLRKCVSAAQRHRPLWTPLVWRKDLPLPIAGIAYQAVGDSLKTELRDRFSDAPDALDEAIEEAAACAAFEEAQETGELRPIAARLIEKLEASGRLTPGFAIKSLRQGKLDLFEHAIARLAGSSCVVVQSAIERQQAKGLALACRAAGIDRSVFPSIHAGFVERQRLSGALEGSALNECAEVFRDLSPEAASAALRRMGANA